MLPGIPQSKDLMNAYGTIVARNYLPHARLLARSFREHHPDDIFVCLVTDGGRDQGWGDDGLNADPGLRVVTPAELPVDAELFSAMAFMYDVMELATALKPFLLQMLLAEVGGGATATYLDPDMYVYAPVPALTSNDAVALLTPHRLSPAPLDTQIPQESLFLRHGAFNLGFVSVNGAATQLLEWWGQRLTVDAVIAPREALFTDQKWMDLAPTYFAVEQLRQAGVNVAWWNIDERQLRHEADRITVNGDPLRLAHFSGYRAGRDPFQPRTQPGPRWQESRAIFEELAQDYLRGLAEETAAGQGRGDEGPGYTFAMYADGRAITSYERRRFRRDMRASFVSGQPLPAAPWHESSSLREEARRRAFAAVDSTVGQALPWDLIAARLKRRKIRA